MGGTFKSIFLAQGRRNANTNLGKCQRFVNNLENPELKKVSNVLLYLKERPEEYQDTFFREDLYTSPKFRADKRTSIYS